MAPKTQKKARKEIIVPNSFPEFRSFSNNDYTEICAAEATIQGCPIPPDQFVVRHGMALSIALNKKCCIQDMQNSDDNQNRIIMLDLAFFLTVNQNGKISGVDIQNLEQISFIPERSKCANIYCKLDGTTPVSLEALCVIPSLLFSKVDQNLMYTQLEMYGATDHHAMTSDFLSKVAIPVVDKTCDKVHVEMERTKRGFWPGGDGFLLLRVYALYCGPLNPIVTPRCRGKIEKISVLIFRSGGGFPKKVEEVAKTEIENQLRIFREQLGDEGDFEQSIVAKLEDHESAYGAGFGVILTAESEDSWLFGGFEMADLSFATEQRLVGPQLKEAAEVEAIRVAQEATKKLKRKLSHRSCIDDYMQAYLLPYMALAKGTSTIFIAKPTLEFKFSKFVVEETFGIDVEVFGPGCEGNPSENLWMVRTQGVGYYGENNFGRNQNINNGRNLGANARS